MTRRVATDSRRRFLKHSVGLAATLCSAQRALGQGVKRGKEPEEEEVSPAEDLMREHGVLERILLVYDEVLARLDARTDFDPAILTGSAAIVRRFIEDYHEQLEERELFPRFEKARVHADLVSVLRTQHKAGRELTDLIRQLGGAAALKPSGERGRLGTALRSFIRMYRPHAAREDTVLFPAFRRLVSGNEYDALGESFEKEEHRLFGADGFERVVAEVYGLERRLGIADLAAFTPTKGSGK